jgi:hypothetical protein
MSERTIAAYIWMFAILSGTGCSEHQSGVGPTGEFATTATASLQGRVVSSSGVGVAGASVLALTPLSTAHKLVYVAPLVTTEADGRFSVTVRRVAESVSTTTVDTVSAQVITRVPAGSTISQADTVLLRFSPVGLVHAPTIVNLVWRGSSP